MFTPAGTTPGSSRRQNKLVPEHLAQAAERLARADCQGPDQRRLPARSARTRSGARTSCAASAPTVWPRARKAPSCAALERGYTGRQPRLQMLQNKEFVDAKVEIFGKHGSRYWQKLGEFKSIDSCSPTNCI